MDHLETTLGESSFIPTFKLLNIMNREELSLEELERFVEITVNLHYFDSENKESSKKTFLDLEICDLSKFNLSDEILNNLQNLGTRSHVFICIKDFEKIKIADFEHSFQHQKL